MRAWPILSVVGLFVFRLHTDPARPNTGSPPADRRNVRVNQTMRSSCKYEVMLQEVLFVHWFARTPAFSMRCQCCRLAFSLGYETMGFLGLCFSDRQI